MPKVQVSSRNVANTYVTLFNERIANGASQAPTWLNALQTTAIAQFGVAGFPSSRDERWRFTNMGWLAERPFVMGNGQALRLSESDIRQHPLGDVTPVRLVFVNGQYSQDLSVVDGLPDGVIASSLADGVANHPDTVQRHLAKFARSDESPFTALSTAFLSDGGLLYVPDNVVLGQPVQFLFLTDHSSENVVTHPRVLVVVGKGASAAVVESYVGLSDKVYWNNPVTEIVVGDNAQLRACRVQLEGERGYHTATTHSDQARDSVYSFTTVALGSALLRHDLNAVLGGTGARCSLYGLSQLGGRQHVDHHSTIEHVDPHCTSWEHFNGILDQRSHGVFTGRVVVHEGAQQTDAKQTNHNLLLAETARADSQPQLEIYADDVKCTHGATVGPIDEKALFYLRSRGLTSEAARNMLTYGFGVEILRQIGIAELRNRLDTLVHSRLEEASARLRGAE